MPCVKNEWIRVKSSLCITANGIIEVSLLQTPIPLFSFVQTLAVRQERFLFEIKRTVISELSKPQVFSAKKLINLSK